MSACPPSQAVFRGVRVVLAAVLRLVARSISTDLSWALTSLRAAEAVHALLPSSNATNAVRWRSNSTIQAAERGSSAGKTAGGSTRTRSDHSPSTRSCGGARCTAASRSLRQDRTRPDVLLEGAESGPSSRTPHTVICFTVPRSAPSSMSRLDANHEIVLGVRRQRRPICRRVGWRRMTSRSRVGSNLRFGMASSGLSAPPITYGLTMVEPKRMLESQSLAHGQGR